MEKLLILGHILSNMMNSHISIFDLTKYSTKEQSNKGGIYETLLRKQNVDSRDPIATTDHGISLQDMLSHLRPNCNYPNQLKNWRNQAIAQGRHASSSNQFVETAGSTHKLGRDLQRRGRDSMVQVLTRRCLDLWRL